MLFQLDFKGKECDEECEECAIGSFKLAELFRKELDSQPYTGSAGPVDPKLYSMSEEFPKSKYLKDGSVTVQTVIAGLDKPYFCRKLVDIIIKEKEELNVGEETVKILSLIKKQAESIPDIKKIEAYFNKTKRGWSWVEVNLEDEDAMKRSINEVQEA